MKYPLFYLFIFLFVKMGRGDCDILTFAREIINLYTTFLLYFVSLECF